MPCRCSPRGPFTGHSTSGLVSLSQCHDVLVHGVLDCHPTDPRGSRGTLYASMDGDGGRCRLSAAGGRWELVLFLCTCLVFFYLHGLRFRRSPFLCLLCNTFHPCCPLFPSLLFCVWVHALPLSPQAEACGSCHTPLCGALAGRRPGPGGHPRHQHPAAISAAHWGGGGGHSRLDGGAENQGSALDGAVSLCGRGARSCQLVPQPSRVARDSLRSSPGLLVARFSALGGASGVAPARCVRAAFLCCLSADTLAIAVVSCCSLDCWVRLVWLAFFRLSTPRR